MFDSIVAIIGGCAAVAVALFNREFYARKGWFAGDKKIPRWQGQLLFGGIGALAIIVGVYRLFRPS